MSFFARSKDSRYKQDWMALGWALLFFWYFSGVYDCLLWLSGLSRFSLIRHSITAEHSAFRALSIALSASRMSRIDERPDSES